MVEGLVVLIFCYIELVTGNREGYIVGGTFVDNIRRFPHAAYLQISMEDGDCTCGSSVLTQNILITVAHCMDDVLTTTAYVGHVDKEKGRPYLVESYKQHRKWKGDMKKKFKYDIALCKLTRPLMLGNAVKRVILMKHPPKAKSGHVAGWGAIEEKDFTESVVLKYAKQKLWTHSECNRLLYRIPTGTICGGSSSSKQDFASSGDSGSGLVIHNNILVGLVSYKRFKISRSLVVYTDPVHYYDWIMKTAKRLNCF